MKILELEGKRITHSMTEYGAGVIKKAYYSRTHFFVEIAFDNGRDTNPFDLNKCIDKGLLILPEFDSEIRKMCQEISSNEVATTSNCFSHTGSTYIRPRPDPNVWSDRWGKVRNIFH